MVIVTVSTPSFCCHFWSFVSQALVAITASYRFNFCFSFLPTLNNQFFKYSAYFPFLECTLTNIKGVERFCPRNWHNQSCALKSIVSWFVGVVECTLIWKYIILVERLLIQVNRKKVRLGFDKRELTADLINRSFNDIEHRIQKACVEPLRKLIQHV